MTIFAKCRFPLLLSLIPLAGCMTNSRNDVAERRDAAIAQMQAASAECKVRFPDGSKQWVAKQQCESDAAQVVRPFLNHPDLFDRYQAERMVYAERLQSGKMTLAEANAAAAAAKSKLAEDEQRRNLAARSVGAQEAVADAAWRASQPPDVAPVFVNPGTGRRF